VEANQQQQAVYSAVEAEEAEHNKELQVGVPWYSEMQWLEMKALCTDQENFYETYGEWRREADKAIVEISNRGLHVKRLFIYVETFKGWCSYHRLQANKNARKKFINYLLNRER